MNDYLLAAILLVLALTGIVVRKAYYAVPLRELKRRALDHEPVAEKLYRAVSYGGSLRGLLWLYIGVTTAGSLVVLARTLPVWASLLVVGPLLWAVFSWLPASRTSSLGTKLAVAVTPAVVWFLNYLHRPLSRGAETVEKRSVTGHTGLFERDDLLALIEQQQRQDDSRLSEEELEIVKRALSFDDYSVADVLVPRKKVKTLKPNDTIGPILIDEVHKSGGGYALVREKPKSPIIGTLAFAQLDLDSSGKVHDLMRPVYYLHEHDSLSQALHAFFATNHAVFVVVNSFEEYVGILTIEAVLKQLLGHIPGDDFDQYKDPGIVANRHTKRAPADEPSDKPAGAPVITDEEVVE